MKQLLRLFFVLALVFGSARFGHGEVDFHMKVLDPANICNADPSFCLILDTTAPLTATFTADTCQFAGVPGLPSDPSTYGCLLLVNLTSDPVTTLDLTFTGLGSLTFTCDTTGPGVLFASASCGSSGGVDDFFFFDGALGQCVSLEDCPVAIVYEDGANPDLFKGTATVNTPAPVPEPASLPLLITGLLFTGIFFGKRQALFATAHK